MSNTNIWNNYWDNDLPGSWADMSPEQRYAHSMLFGTDWHKEVEDEWAGAQLDQGYDLYRDIIRSTENKGKSTDQNASVSLGDPVAYKGAPHSGYNQQSQEQQAASTQSVLGDNPFDFTYLEYNDLKGGDSRDPYQGFSVTTKNSEDFAREFANNIQIREGFGTVDNYIDYMREFGALIEENPELAWWETELPAFEEFTDPRSGYMEDLGYAPGQPTGTKQAVMGYSTTKDNTYKTAYDGMMSNPEFAALAQQYGIQPVVQNNDGDVFVFNGTGYTEVSEVDDHMSAGDWAKIAAGVALTFAGTPALTTALTSTSLGATGAAAVAGGATSAASSALRGGNILQDGLIGAATGGLGSAFPVNNSASNLLQADEFYGAAARGGLNELVSQGIEGDFDINDLLIAAGTQAGLETVGDLFEDSRVTRNPEQLQSGANILVDADGNFTVGDLSVEDTARLANTSDLYGLLGENGAIANLTGFDIGYLPTDYLGDAFEFFSPSQHATLTYPDGSKGTLISDPDTAGYAVLMEDGTINELSAVEANNAWNNGLIVESNSGTFIDGLDNYDQRFSDPFADKSADSPLSGIYESNPFASQNTTPILSPGGFTVEGGTPSASSPAYTPGEEWNPEEQLPPEYQFAVAGTNDIRPETVNGDEDMDIIEEQLKGEEKLPGRNSGTPVPKSKPPGMRPITPEEEAKLVEQMEKDKLPAEEVEAPVAPEEPQELPAEEVEAPVVPDDIVDEFENEEELPGEGNFPGVDYENPEEEELPNAEEELPAGGDGGGGVDGDGAGPRGVTPVGRSGETTTELSDMPEWKPSTPLDEFMANLGKTYSRKASSEGEGESEADKLGDVERLVDKLLEDEVIGEEYLTDFDLEGDE